MNEGATSVAVTFFSISDSCAKICERIGLPARMKSSMEFVPEGGAMRLKFGSRSPMMVSHTRSCVAQYFASFAEPALFCETQFAKSAGPW